MNKPKFGTNLMSATEKLKALQPEEPVTAPVATSQQNEDPWVSFTVQIKRSTYMQIKQAEYWVSGFGEMREHADKAWQEYLKQLPGSEKPLPEIVLDKLLKTSKKLQP